MCLEIRGSVRGVVCVVPEEQFVWGQRSGLCGGQRSGLCCARGVVCVGVRGVVCVVPEEWFVWGPEEWFVL
jgi:hypothetical protein